MGVHSILEQRGNKNKTLFGGNMSETKLLSYVPFISSFELNEIRKEFDVNKIFNLRKGQAEAFFAMKMILVKFSYYRQERVRPT